MNRIALLLVPVLTLFSFLHSGRTDAWGGHYNHSTGEYHYHHGRPSHDHYDIDGDGIIDCPYTFDYGESANQHNVTEIIALVVFAAILYYALFAFLVTCGATDYVERLAKRMVKKKWSKSASDRFWKIAFVVIGIVIEVCLLHDYLS